MTTAPLVFATLSLDVGGAERQIAAVTAELARRGWPVRIFCFNREGAAADQVRRAGVEVIAPPVPAAGRDTAAIRRAYGSMRAAVSLKRMLQRDRPQIVHFFLTEPYLFGAPAALAAQTPIRIMSRREINPASGRLLQVRKIERRLHPRMTAILGNSRQVIADLRGEGAGERQLGLIYNGIDLSRFAVAADKASTRRELGIADTAVVAIKIANLIGYKGHADLLNAIARLEPGQRARLMVLLVGRDDGGEAALRRQAAELGIAQHLKFLGLRSDVPRLIAAADLAVHASHMEGFANAILEAMAGGLPMIATAVGGTLDQVSDNKQGLLVPVAEPGALAQALARLIEDAELRGRLGSEARRHVCSRYSMSACVDRYEALYRGLLAGKAPSEISQVAVPSQ